MPWCDPSTCPVCTGKTPILFGPEEHVGLIGQTRTGKTTFAKKLIIPSYGRIGTVDSKTPMRPDGKTDFPDLPVATVDQFLGAAKKRDGFFSWRMKFPVGDAGLGLANYLCDKHMAESQRTALYWDEVSDFCDAATISPSMLNLIRKGGGLNLNFVWGSQRPQLVNKTIYNNTHHLFAFYVFPYDARVARPYFPELEEGLDRIPFGSHRSLYRDPGGVVHLLGACEA